MNGEVPSLECRWGRGQWKTGNFYLSRRPEYFGIVPDHCFLIFFLGNFEQRYADDLPGWHGEVKRRISISSTASNRWPQGGRYSCAMKNQGEHAKDVISAQYRAHFLCTVLRLCHKAGSGVVQ
jgi:hypothetical protein